MLKKLTLSLTILLLLCGVSFADFIYTTENGTLGTLHITSSLEIEQSADHHSNISRPLLTAYWNKTTTGIMLIDRYAADSGDRAYIFSPSNLASYTKSADIPGVYGAEFAGYADSGYSIFLASGSEIYDVDTSSFKVKHSFDCTSVISEDGYDTEIYSLAVDLSSIHILARAGDSTKYIRLDGQLKREGVKAFMSRDVSADTSLVISTSSNLPAICHSSGIDVMNRSGRFRRLLSTDCPVKAICPDSSGNGYYYAEQIQNGTKYTNTIYHSSENSYFTPITIESSSPNIKLLRDNSRTEFFAAMTDEQITVLMYSGSGTTSTWEYSASELGGKLWGITTASVSGYNAKSSSSGCNFGGTLILLAVIPFLMKRK